MTPPENRILLFHPLNLHSDMQRDMQRILYGSLLMLAVVGCAVGPKYSRPETKQPTGYVQETEKTDSATNLKFTPWESVAKAFPRPLIQRSRYDPRRP